MFKFTAALVAAVNAGKIPLHKAELSLEDVEAQRMFYEYHSEEILGGKLPVKDYMNTQYFVTVQVGTPAQEFTVVPDTGSSNLWMYSHSCYSIACLRHNRFNPKKSSTFQDDGQDFNIEYGSGGVSGTTGKDVVHMGDATATMTFGEIKKTSGAMFLVSQLDGILGLAYPTISVDKLPVFIQESDLTDHSFSFYLHSNPDESYMMIPGIDEDAKFEKIQTHAVKQEGYWALNLTGLKQGDKDIAVDNIMGVIDSGTSLIAGPKAIVDPLIDGITVDKHCAGIEDLPDITFKLDDHEYVLTYNDYVLKVGSGKSTQCVLGVQSIDAPEGFNYIIMGDVFMRPYPTKFDYDNNEVTFFTEKATEFLQ